MSGRIDRARYMNTPLSTGRQLLSLARLLRKHTPADASADVLATAAVLDAQIETSAQAYADRIRLAGPSVAAEDREDDDATDVLLGILRERLGHWRVLARPTFQRLAAAELPDGVDYPALFEQARAAERIANRLFAAGFDAIRAPYPEQAEHMLALERIIAQQQLGPDLDALVGGPFYGLFRAANARYQAMVARRAAAEDAGVDLRAVRASLRNAIQDYVIALLAMIRDHDPDNVARIRRALGPVDALREQLASARRGRPGDASGDEGGDDGDGDDGEALVSADDRAAVDELRAEQQAVDAELGLLDADAP